MRNLLFIFTLAIGGSASAEPRTVDEHMAMATEYRQQAQAQRQVAAFHRQMAAEYAASVPSRAAKGIENPWKKKMDAHCGAFIAEAERLANEADRSAAYHTFRALELQGR